MGAIADALAGVSDHRERGRIKARMLAEALGSSRTFTRGAYTVTVSELRFADPLLAFHLNVTKGGAVLYDDDVAVVNPPIMVQSGTKQVQAHWGGGTQTVTVPVYTEAPLQALREVVSDAVRRAGVPLP